MPTIVTKTIKASGGDYSTIAAWEADTDNDLVAADQIQVGQLFDKAGSAAWDEITVIADANVDATRYRVLTVPRSQRHDGTDTGANIDPTTSGHAFNIQEDEFRLEGMNIKGLVGSSSEGIRVSADNIRISNCIIHNLTVAGDQDGIYFNANSITAYIWNCSFWVIRRSAVMIQATTSVTAYVFNCTGWDLLRDGGSINGGFGCANNFTNTSSVMHCKNVSSHVSSGAAFRGKTSEGQTQCTNCAADDNTITAGVNVVNNGGELENVIQADQFISLVTGEVDLHLKPRTLTSKGSSLIDRGVNLASDPNLSFTDDLDGEARGLKWSIGMDEILVIVKLQYLKAVPIRKRFGVIEDRNRKTKPHTGEIATLDYRQHPRYRGCVGHWMMNEGGGNILRDISGLGNHGTLNNMTPEDWVPGQFGKALDFDGDNDFVTMGNVHDFVRTAARSFAMWARPDNVGSRQHPLSKADASSPFAGWAIQMEANGDLRFEYRVNSGNQLQVKTDSPVFTNGVWTHFVITYNNETVVIYIDGVEVPSTKNVDTLTSSISTNIEFNVGSRDNAGNTEIFDGIIDDVRLYNRELNAAEVRSLYTDPFLEFKQEIPFAIPPFKPVAGVLDDWNFI